MPVWPSPAVAERRGDVACYAAALPHRVLRCHGGDLAGAGEIRHSRGVAAGEDFRMTRHAKILVDRQAASGRCQAQCADQRIGAYSDAPDEGAGGDELAAGRQHAVVGRLLDRGAGADLYAAAGQHPVGSGGQMPIQLRQYSRGGLQQQPPDLLVTQRRVVACDGPGEQLAVRGDLGPGIAGADHHESAARVLLGGGEAARRAVRSAWVGRAGPARCSVRSGLALQPGLVRRFVRAGRAGCRGNAGCGS